MEVQEQRVAPTLTLDANTPLLDAYAAFYTMISKGESAVQQALVQLRTRSQECVFSSPEKRLKTWLKRVCIAGLQSMETDIEYFKAENNDMNIQSLIDSYFHVEAIDCVTLTYVPRNDVAVDVLNDLVSDIALGRKNTAADGHVTESLSTNTSAVVAISASAALYIDVPQSLKTYVEPSLTSGRFWNKIQRLYESGFDPLSVANNRDKLLQLYYCDEQTDSKGLTLKEIDMLRLNAVNAHENAVSNKTPYMLLLMTKLCCTFIKCRTMLFPNVYALKAIKKAFLNHSRPSHDRIETPIACVARVQICALPTTPPIRVWAIPNIYSITDPKLQFMLLYARYDVTLSDGTLLTIYAPRFENQSKLFLLDLFRQSSRTLGATHVSLRSDVLYSSDHVDVSRVEYFYPDQSLRHIKDSGLFVQRLCCALGAGVQTRFDGCRERRLALGEKYDSVKECVHVFDGGVWQLTCMQSDFTLAYKMRTFIRLTSKEASIRRINSVFSAFCKRFFTWKLDSCPGHANVPERVYHSIYMNIRADGTGSSGAEETKLQQEHLLFFNKVANRSIIAAKFFVKTPGDFFKLIFPPYFQPPSRLFYTDCTVGSRMAASPVVLHPCCVVSFGKDQDEPVHMYVRRQARWRKVSTVATRAPNGHNNIQKFTLLSDALDIGHIIRRNQAKGHATVLLYQIRE